MHMLSKIFNTLEKVASDNKRIIQSHDTMEKEAATVTHGLRALLKARKDSVARAMRKNPKLTRQQALDAFYKRYGLQVGKGGKISAIEGAKLNNRALARQQEWLAAMKQNQALSSEIKNLKTLNPKEVTSKRLRDLNQRFNLSEANGDYILAQQGGRQLGRKVNIAGKPMRFSYDQQIFKLNHKPSTIMRRLRRKPASEPAPGSGVEPGLTPSGPTPLGPTPTGTTPKPTPKPGPDGGQYGPTGPAPADAPVGNGLFNNNWWKYGLAGAGGVLLGRTTAPSPQPMPVMMPPQPMPATMYNGMQY